MFLNLSHDVKTAHSLSLSFFSNNREKRIFLHFLLNRRHLSQHDVKVDNRNYAEKVLRQLSLSEDVDNLSVAKEELRSR